MKKKMTKEEKINKKVDRLHKLLKLTTWAKSSNDKYALKKARDEIDSLIRGMSTSDFIIVSEKLRNF